MLYLFRLKIPMVLLLCVGFCLFAGCSLNNKLQKPPEPKYKKSECGSIFSKKSKWEWYIGPDRLVSAGAAKNWIADIKACGGGWEMPEAKHIKDLFIKETIEQKVIPLSTQQENVLKKNTKKKLTLKTKVTRMDPEFKDAAGGEFWKLWYYDISGDTIIELERSGNSLSTPLGPYYPRSPRRPIAVRKKRK